MPGWTDAATAPTKRNVQFSTINYNPLLGLSEQGFPTKPYEFRTSKKNPVLNATRIDYVMAKGAGIVPLDYEVVIRLNPTARSRPTTRRPITRWCARPCPSRPARSRSSPRR